MNYENRITCRTRNGNTYTFYQYGDKPFKPTKSMVVYDRATGERYTIIKTESKQITKL